MNEQIKELFSRAGGAITMIDGAVLTYTDHFDPERFAQLIVRECMAMCQTAVGNADYNTGRLHCLNNIKEHFGVE